MVGVKHRADVRQPVAEQPVDVVFTMRPTGLDCVRCECKDEGTVRLGEKADMHTLLQDERFKAR